MKKLTVAEQTLANKLADAGPTQEEAEAWVRRIVNAAWNRGKNYR